MSDKIRVYYHRGRQELSPEKRQHIWGIWFNRHHGVYWISHEPPDPTCEIGPWEYVGAWPKSEIGYLKETFRF